MAMHTRRPMFRIVAASTPAAAGPPVDPIYAVIEAHQKAHRDHIDAVRVEFAFEEETVCERDMDAEQLRAFKLLQKSESAAFDRMEEMSIALVTTRPTTLAGIGAVCRYLKSLLEEGTPGLFLEKEFGDVESGMGIFCDTIAASIEGMPLTQDG